MRQILVDHGRRAQAAKRGSGIKEQLDDRDGAQTPEFSLVEELLEQLRKTDPEAARVVECKVFSGMTDKETASATRIPIPKVREAWSFARAWMAARARGRNFMFCHVGACNGNPPLAISVSSL